MIIVTIVFKCNFWGAFDECMVNTYLGMRTYLSYITFHSFIHLATMPIFFNNKPTVKPWTCYLFTTKVNSQFALSMCNKIPKDFFQLIKDHTEKAWMINAPLIHSKIPFESSQILSPIWVSLYLTKHVFARRYLQHKSGHIPIWLRSLLGIFDTCSCG